MVATIPLVDVDGAIHITSDGGSMAILLREELHQENCLGI
jgi:hypothetical protein